MSKWLSDWSSSYLEELSLEPNQRTGQNLKQVACALAVFVPFEIASVLLALLTGIQVSPTSIWNWVQEAGEKAMQQLKKKLDAGSSGICSKHDANSSDET